MNKIMLPDFNEARLFHIPMVPCPGGRISEVPVSEGEIERVRGLGINFRLVPVECPHCAETRRVNQELSDEVVRLAEEVGRLKGKKR